MSKQEKSAPVQTSEAAAFSKSQLIEAKRYTPGQRDVLAALLEDGKTYTFEQADQLIHTFAKGTVD
ncbi:hypothetical protein ACFSR7_07650 [Cohnella sp. GCM10020058]|uniref:hypothetical protein n=1 Tax=Cohnella sp. GCM10020058 TaxID=3317330 RepID=UPI00363E078C